MKISLNKFKTVSCGFFSRSRIRRRAGVTRPRRGTVLVFVALGMVVILGCGAISVDYGLLLADKNRLQRACDAAALAGTSHLKSTDDDATDTYNARLLAVAVAAQNGVTVNHNDITFLNNNQQIRVPALTTRSFFFGAAIGVPNKQVSAAAIAALSAGDDPTTNTVVPIGVTWETYNTYVESQQPLTLELVRQNKETFGFEEFVLFDLRDTSAKAPPFMARQITGQDAEQVSLGDFETTLNAATPAQRKHFTGAMDDMFDRAEDSPWNDNGPSGSNNNYYQGLLNGTLPRDNPRVMTFIITPETSNPSSGTFNTEVQGFATVYVESLTVTGGGNNTAAVDMVIRFLPPSIVSSDGGWTTNPDAPLSGVRIASLIG